MIRTVAQIVGAGGLAQFERRGKAHRQVDLDAIGPERVGQRRRLGDEGRGQHFGEHDGEGGYLENGEEVINLQHEFSKNTEIEG